MLPLPLSGRRGHMLRHPRPTPFSHLLVRNRVRPRCRHRHDSARGSRGGRREGNDQRRRLVALCHRGCAPTDGNALAGLDSVADRCSESADRAPRSSPRLPGRPSPVSCSRPVRDTPARFCPFIRRLQGKRALRRDASLPLWDRRRRSGPDRGYHGGRPRRKVRRKRLAPVGRPSDRRGAPWPRVLHSLDSVGDGVVTLGLGVRKTVSQ